MRFVIRRTSCWHWFESPAAYRFMSSSFRVPRQRTLQKFINGLNIGCGFNTDCISTLKRHAERWRIVLCFDILIGGHYLEETALKAKLQYSDTMDKAMIEPWIRCGFVDLDEFSESTSQIATQALQFIVSWSVRLLSMTWAPAGHTRRELYRDVTVVRSAWPRRRMSWCRQSITCRSTTRY